MVADNRFDLDLLDEQDPFEIDAQAAHLFKHPHMGVEDVEDVWASDPLFYLAKPPAHWLMCAEVSGRVLVVPLAPSRDGDPRRSARSVVTWPPRDLLPSSGGTEDADDTRAGV